MSIYDDDIEKAIEALKAYNEKRNSTPARRTQPLTVHVYKQADGFLWFAESDGHNDDSYLGAFILQPKEQT